MESSFIAIDFETLDDGTPWQLGAARFVDGVPMALKDWRFNGDILDYFEEIHVFLADSTLVAHNIACERTILTRLAPLTPWGPWVDTLKLARKRWPKLESYALGDLCERLGIDMTPTIVGGGPLAGRTWHDGLYDAVACGLLYGRIMA